MEFGLGGIEDGSERGGSSVESVVEIDNQVEFLVGRRFKVWGFLSSSAMEERRGDRVYVTPFASRVLAMEEREGEMGGRSGNHLHLRLGEREAAFCCR